MGIDFSIDPLTGKPFDELEVEGQEKDPLSATQDGYAFEREAVLTGEEEDYEVATLNNAPIMASMRRYMFDRFGEDGKQASTESDKDFYDRYMDHYRYMLTNSYSAGKEIDYLRSASVDAKRDMATIYTHIENNAPGILDQSFSDQLDNVKDNVFSMASDPLNLAMFAVGSAATGGVGGAAMLTARRLAMQGAIKRALTTSIAGLKLSPTLRGVASYSALGGGFGAVEDAMQQELMFQAQVDKYLDEDGNVELAFDPELTADQRETDLGRVAMSAGIGALLGAGEGFIAGRQAKKGAIEYFNTRLSIIGKKVNAETLAVEAVTKDPVKGDVTGDLIRAIDVDTEEGKLVVNALEDIKNKINIDAEDSVRREPFRPNPNAAADMDALDQVGKLKDPDVVTQAQLRVSIARNIGDIAADIIRVKTVEHQDLAKMGLEPTDDVLMKLILDGADAVKKKDKVSTELIVDIFKYLKDRSNQGIEGLEEVDSVLELSGRRDDFVNVLTRFSDETFGGSELYKKLLGAFDETMSQAGRTLRSGSRVGQLLAEHGAFTKEQRKRLKEAFATPDGTVSVYNSLREAFDKFGRIRRSLMTITPATTARNVFSGFSNITFATGANTIESIIYNMGKVASDKDFTFGNGLRDIWLDSSGMLTNLVTQNTTAGRAIVDASLVNHPTMMRKILRNNAEFGEAKNLPELSNFVNGLNVAADGFFRRALFAYELDRSFRRAGIKEGFKGVMLDGKSIPAEFLEKAGAETLKGTFSYSFKKGRGSGENVAAAFVDFIETVPFGTVLVPFARFTANSIAFQYQYSPLNTAMGAMNMVATATANLGRKEKKKLDYAGLNKAFSRGVVGTAALYGAMKIRMDQQENPFWKVTVAGNDIDARPFFPLVPYLLLADLIIRFTGMGEDKMKATLKDSMREGSVTSGTPALGVKELVEGIAGLNMRATGQLPMFDALFGMVQKDETGGYFGEDKVGTAVGEFVSSYLKTPFVGLNFVKDVMGSFDQNEAIIRDMKAGVEGTGFVERGTSAFKESFKQVLPVKAQEAAGFEASPIRQFAYRQAPAFRQNTLLKQTTGARLELPPNDVEQEMMALGLEEWKRFKPSGDRVADAYTKEAHSDYMLTTIRGFMASDFYRDMSKDKRRVFMNNVITDTKKEAKVIGEHFSIKDIVARNSIELPPLMEAVRQTLNKGDTEKARLLYKQVLHKQLYTYTGPFPRMRWLDRVDRRTKAVVNAHLKVMYQDMLANDTLVDTQMGQLLDLAVKEHGLENLTIEKSGLYGLGVELGKRFRSSLKP